MPEREDPESDRFWKRIELVVVLGPPLLVGFLAARVLWEDATAAALGAPALMLVTAVGWFLLLRRTHILD